EEAEVIVGGARHHALTDTLTAERISWPSPFDALIDTLQGLRGRRAVVLATGDPLWFSVGERLVDALGTDALTIHPQLSAFQLSAARMGWAMSVVETLTVHGRPVETLLPALVPGARLLVLTSGADTPRDVAALLTRAGFGPSEMTVLAALGGPSEARIAGRAETWSETAPALHTLAITLHAAEGADILPAAFGLPDAAFEGDGTMTKREVRAITLGKLAPRPGACLWDVGAGCGSVAIEWMRAARQARAVAIEPRADRRAYMATNATALGVPGLKIIEGSAPEALVGLPSPDAVFLGGGLSEETFHRSMEALRPHGRLVANAVTIESEGLLVALHAAHGGELVKIAIQRAEPVGRLTGWKPAMPVTQLSLVKR
ncbi:MAG: precorrin-6y C5,15-methyltransferase (decarboxylating) subunit CbiE, partial [Pseudomonadota bacterium]